MPHVTAKTDEKTANQHKPRKSIAENNPLHLRYGRIGISAVAAAARYQGSARNPAYAPSATKAAGGATTV